MSQQKHKIITHNGDAHVDDFLSSCIALALDDKIIMIERKEPYPEDIVNPYVWVLDIGNELYPEGHAYDHHQHDWKECTLSLLLKDIKLWYRARNVYRWLEPTVLLDSMGVTYTAEQYNVETHIISAFSSFLNDGLLIMFSHIHTLTEDEYLFHVMRDMGKLFLSQIEVYEETYAYSKLGCITHVQDVPVYLIDNIPLNTFTSSLIKKAKKDSYGEGGIVVYPNNRPKGTFCVVRCDDDARIDFRKIKQDDIVEFIHANGFMCVLKNIDNMESYIKQAIV